ncbi:MAG: coenzyme F420-0:L-glutamate ligase [Gammaproteobacteria bacterium]|nr:coenzyme F420-0:L-glutamate ligase [Gammaproteobacteria bacterium]
MRQLNIFALEKIPLIIPGDNLAKIIFNALKKSKLVIQDGDVFVIAQKIVSKAENRYVTLSEILPSKKASVLAQKTDKDPRLVELILRESKKVVRFRKGVIVVENKLGFIHANAGIDRSNIESDSLNPRVLLLPKNPDLSAQQLQKELSKFLRKKVGVIINDSTGRAWRNGIVGIAIGCSGVSVLSDLRGQKDLYGRTLEVTEVGIADELASSASILMGQSNEGLPVVIIQGLKLSNDKRGSKALLRLAKDDLFR